MSISLTGKLSLMTNDQTVKELHELLDRPHRTSISWTGQRLVSINGYSGSVEINDLARKYLQASPFNRDSSCTPKEKIECYKLWDRVQDLYASSDAELDKTWVFRYLTQ